MKNISLIILILCGLNLKSQVTIMDCIQLKDSVFGEYEFGELTGKNEVIDLKNCYYEIEWYEEDEQGNKSNYLTLFQAVIFKNFDNTWTLGITSYDSDVVCSWHDSHFYEISKDGDSITEIDIATIMPELNWNIFLSESSSIEVIEKYMTEITDNYLSPDATLEDVLNEMYDLHYIMPKQGKIVKVELTFCDYIPQNEAAFTNEDYLIVSEDFKSVELKYNRKLKVFELR
jgi:hypothetical protein